MVSSSPQGRLPTGFKEVEWLQGSGTQYCETDINPIYSNSSYTSIKGDLTVLNKTNSQFEITSRWSQQYSGVMSEFRYGFQYHYVQRLPQNVYEAQFSYYYGLLSMANRNVNYINSVFPIDIHYELNQNNIIVNQNTISKSSDIKYSATKPILIGAYYTGYSADPIHAFNNLTRVKSFNVYDNNNLVYEIVPCYRTSDNKTGFMKITIADGSTTFFPNLGTDEWIIGPVV